MLDIKPLLHFSVKCSFKSHFGVLCGLVVRVLGYRCRGLVSIAGATRFSEK
jgi:hypothetical protein